MAVSDVAMQLARYANAQKREEHAWVDNEFVRRKACCFFSNKELEVNMWQKIK